MQRPPVSPAVEVVAEAQVPRNSRPDLPAVAVLDQVMRGRYGRKIDFGSLATPPPPFSLLVADALDCMPPSDWEGLWRRNSHNKVRPFLLKLWADEVWPKFVVRYGLCCRAAGPSALRISRRSAPSSPGLRSGSLAALVSSACPW